MIKSELDEIEQAFAVLSTSEILSRFDDVRKSFSNSGRCRINRQIFLQHCIDELNNRLEGELRDSFNKTSQWERFKKGEPCPCCSRSLSVGSTEMVADQEKAE